MKIPSRGHIFRRDGIISMEQALRYVHSFPVINAIIGIDNMDRLEENIEITRNFYRYNERQLRELEQLIAHFSRDGNWFK